MIVAFVRQFLQQALPVPVSDRKIQPGAARKNNKKPPRNDKPESEINEEIAGRGSRVAGPPRRARRDSSLKAGCCRYGLRSYSGVQATTYDLRPTTCTVGCRLRTARRPTTTISTDQEPLQATGNCTPVSGNNDVKMQDPDRVVEVVASP